MHVSRLRVHKSLVVLRALASLPSHFVPSLSQKQTAIPIRDYLGECSAVNL